MGKYTPKQYAEVLYDLVNEASESRSKETIKKFVGAMLKNGDLSKANLVIQEFEKVYLLRSGKEKIEVTTVDKDSSKLKDKLKGEVVFREDAKILGGVRIKVGDKLIDNTLRARVNRLKESLEI